MSTIDPAPRLRLYGNPVRLLFSQSLWRAVGYLLSYLVVSGLLFAAALSASIVTAVAAVTIALVPLMIASAAVLRGCAAVARFMLRPIFRQPVPGRYPEQRGQGLWRRARGAWTSGATWRDVAYLIGLWAPLYALATVAVAIWAALLGGITLPLWYRHVADVCVGNCGDQHTPGVLIGSYPNGPHGADASGLWIYHSLGPALLVAAGCLVAFLLMNYLLVLTARAHGLVAKAVLRGPSDPLSPVREVLAGPGPLGSLTSRGGG